MSAVHPAPKRPIVSVVLVEQSSVCEDGGGFERVVWRVRVNDGWLRLDQLVQKKSVGDFSAKLGAVDDPHDVSTSESWSSAPSRVWWRRETLVKAPVGTRFWRRLWQPDPERARERLVLTMPFAMTDLYLVLCANGELSREDVVAKRRITAATREPALSAEESRARADALLRSLDKIG